MAQAAQIYAETSFFDGAAFQHIADREERQRLDRKREEARKAVRDAERRAAGVLKLPERLPLSLRDDAVDGLTAILTLSGLRKAAKEIGA